MHNDVNEQAMQATFSKALETNTNKSRASHMSQKAVPTLCSRLHLSVPAEERLRRWGCAVILLILADPSSSSTGRMWFL